jgi:hypothetical protein
MKIGLPNPGLCQPDYQLRVYENQFTKSGFMSTGFTDSGFVSTGFIDFGFVSTGFTDSEYIVVKK